ncbi:MAG TPA: DUF2752 domain-containing protein [Candidatus Dormibacteraeota bacterium]
MVSRAGAGDRREPLLLFGGLALWLAYTRFFLTLQTVHLTLPACPFYTLTGHPCPFCGGTRSYAAMWRGDVGAALRYYPLGPALFALTLGGAGYLLWSGLTGRRVVLAPRVWHVLVGVAAVALAVSWSLKLFWLGN